MPETAVRAGSFVQKLGRGAWDMVAGTGKAILQAPARLSVAFFALILTLFLLVNASAVFAPELAERMEQGIVVYLLFQVTFTASFGIKNPFANYSLKDFAVVFAVAFVAGAVVLLAIASSLGYEPPKVAAGGAGVALVVVTIFVIAYSEEIAFRSIIPDFLARAFKNRLAAQGLSALLFAAFHYAVYAGAFAPLLIAAVAGAFFGLLKETIGRHGLTVAIALHSAYNAFALGLL